MNSIWLSYYVQTKKMGAYAEDFAKMVKHFKRAVEILKEREAEEMSYIKKYFPEADQIPEWEIKLSHWKLIHNIRFINDFQGKRIAKYLQEGKFLENKNLFVKETFYNINATNNGTYQRTKFRYVSAWDKNKEASEFEKGSPYYMQAFYVDTPHSYNVRWQDEKKKEENAIKIASDIPKLEALVPDRLILDEKKLLLVNEHVKNFMEEHDIKVSDLKDCPIGLSFDNGKLGFIKVENLEKSDRNKFFDMAQHKDYPDYILKSECWKVAYYDFIHGQYEVLLHDIKLAIHDNFMNATISR